MPLSFGATVGKTTAKQKNRLSIPVTDSLVAYFDANNPNSYPGAGTVWQDLSPNKYTASLSSAIVSYANRYGGHLVMSSDATNIPGQFTLSSTLSTNTFTMMAWINPNATQVAWAGIMIDRSGANQGTGLQFADAGNTTLRFIYNGTAYSFNTGLTVPPNQWSLVTLVVTPTNITPYINGTAGNVYTAAIGAAPLTTERLGWDNGAGRVFQGKYGAALLYNKSLSASEVSSMYDYFKTRYITNSTLKVHYDLSETTCYPGSGTSLTDISNNSATGTLVNGTLVQNNSLVFDGVNDYVTFSKPSWLTGVFSTSFWIKWSTTGSAGSSIKALIDNNHYSNTGFVIQDRPDLPNQPIQFALCPTANNGAVSTFKVGDGTWRHVVATWDGTTAKLYIDGTLNGSASQSQCTYNPTIYLGCVQQPDRFNNGSMANFQMFSSALSASDVSQIYSATKGQFYPTDFPANVSGLQMWLRADSGATDSTGKPITADNTPVDIWSDQTTNKKQARQSTAGSRPVYRTNAVNGLPAIQFDGTDDEMLLDGLATSGSNLSYFAVIKPTGSGAQGYEKRFFGSKVVGSTGINFGCTTSKFYAVVRDNAGSSGDTSWGTSQAFGDTILSSVIMDSSNTKLRVNRNQVSTGIRTTWSGTGASEYIGSDGASPLLRFQGYICEILVFNRALTGRELNQVEQYLAAKWGISKAVVKDNEGLVAHWDAGNTNSYSGSGTTWSDLTGNGNHATFANTPAHIPDSGGYFNFTQSTSQRATVSTLTNMPIGDSSVTIEAWIKHGGVANSAIVGWGNYGSFAQCQGLRADASSITWYNWGYDTGTGNVLTAGQWHHIVAKYDANTRTKQIWVDGVLANSTMASGPLNIAASNFTIGKAYSTQYAEGGIASLKIYNRPISSEEIVIKYNETKGRFASFTPSNQGMSLWLRADSGVLDASGNQISSHNTTIATWRDKSGSGYDATQATDANRPLWYNAANGQNNLPAIYCDGTNRWLERREYLFTTAVTYFVVCKWADTTGRYWPFDAGGYYPYHFAVEQHNNLNRVGLFTTENSWVTSLTPTAGAQMFAVTANAVSGATININTDVTFRRNKTTHTLSSNGQNGSTWRNYADASGKGFSVGRPTTLNALQMKGQIYEIIVYNRVLSASERAAVEDYLAAKWNIT